MRPLLPLLAASLLFAEDAPSPRRGALLFEDEFSASALAPGWRAAKGKWELKEGKLHGTELASDHHAAVVRHPVKYRDAVIEVVFRLEAGAKQAALSLNVPGGHLCRVILRPDGFSLHRDPDKKSGAPAVLLARKATTIAPGAWHTLTVTLRNTLMTAQLDGGEVVGGEHPSLSVEKADIGLPVTGAAAFDAVRVWGIAHP